MTFDDTGGMDDGRTPSAMAALVRSIPLFSGSLRDEVMLASMLLVPEDHPAGSLVGTTDFSRIPSSSSAARP